MSTDIRDQWIKLETAVAAKKIETNIAHITKLYSHYSIAVSNKRKCKDNSFQFKFPHEKKWTDVLNENDLPTLLATSAFPLIAMDQYSKYKGGKEGARMVEEALKGNKRLKVAGFHPCCSPLGLGFKG
jgi:hypothetical protein